MRLNEVLPVAVLLSAAALHVAPAHAQIERDVEPRFGLRVGVNHSDNPARASEAESPESLTFASVGLDVGLEREAPRLLVYLDGNLDYYDYGSDDLENETLGNIEGGLQIRMVPELLVWDWDREIGNVRRDPFRSDGPGNRERLSITTTGPTLTLPLTERDSLRIALGRSDRVWDQSDRLDSASDSGTIGWIRELSARQQIGLTATSEQVEYVIDAIPKYEIGAAYLTFRQTFVSGGISFSIGRNRVAVENQESDAGLYVDIVWNRRLAAYSSISFTGGRRFEDSANQFRVRIADVGPGEEVYDLPPSAGPFVRTRAGLTYSLNRPRLGFAFGMDLGEEQYEAQVARDRKRARLSGSAYYRFADNTNIGVQLFEMREEFRIDSRTRAERGAAVGLSHRLSAAWNMEVQYLRRRRHDLAGQGGFEENRISLRFAWVPGR